MIVRSDHPRIWLTPSRLADLKNEATAGDPRWNTLKSYVDSHFNNSYPPGIESFALIYQITGDSKYADRAIALASGSLNASDITRDSGYPTRTTLSAVAICYDWCNDRIVSLGLKNWFVSGLTAQADFVWPETNPTTPLYGISGAGVPGSNYWWGHMHTWMTGLALYGDTPKAVGYVNNCINRWNTVALPFFTSTDLTKSATGGYLAEGTNYGPHSVSFIFDILAAHYTATGDNLATSGGLTWCKDTIVNQIHITAPSRSSVYTGGDQTLSAGGTISDDLARSFLVAQTILDTTTAGYARYWYDHIGNQYFESNQYIWQDFLWYNYSKPSIDYTKVLPTAYWSAGAGFVSSRSDWTTGATWVTMLTGPSDDMNDYGGHSDRAHNGFTIWREDWLACQQKIRYNGIAEQGSFNNTVTVGGNEQYRGSNNSCINHFEESPSYCYFSGEASPAYQKPSNPTLLNGFRRDIFHLNNYIVVCDRLDAPDRTMAKRLHHNSQSPVLISGNNYIVIDNTTKLFATSLLPAGSVISNTPVYKSNDGTPTTVPNGSSVSSRIDITAPIGNTVDYFLTFMETAAGNQPTLTPVSNLVTNSIGVQGVQVGNQVAVFDMRTGPVSGFSFKVPGAGVRAFFIATNCPSMQYTWSKTDTTGASATGSVMSTQHGILNWSTSANSDIMIMLAPASGIVIPTSGVVSTSGNTDTLEVLQKKYAALLVYATGLSGTVTSLTSTIDSLMATNKSMQTTNNTLSTNIVGLNTQIAGLQTQIAKLNTMISNIKSILGV